MDDEELSKSLTSHSHRMDDAIAAFMAALGLCIKAAQHRVNNTLLHGLVLGAGGTIARNARNVKLLRSVPQLWTRALDESGLEGIVTGFTRKFPDQIREFQHILQVVNHTAKEPLPLPNFTQADMAYFDALQQTTGIDLATTVEGAATSLRTIPMSAGISIQNLTQFIIDKTDTVKSRAETIADTSLMGYYRTVSAVGFERIEKRLGRALLYEFMGPLDQVTSQKCEHAVLETRKHGWTRAYIDSLQPYPGSPGPVFIFGFHFRCRHSFQISLRQFV